MENLKMENGKLFYYGNGSNGWKWYQIADEDDVIAHYSGRYYNQVTVKQAHKNGTLKVHDAGGDSMSRTPYWE